MSMAEVIKSIEREALREAQSREIGGRNGKPIDCSTLGDEPVIVADNEADKQALRAALSQKFCGDISGGYLTAPCISKDDSIPEWLRKNVEKELRDCLKEQ
jgi:hypothetical protein